MAPHAIKESRRDNPGRDIVVHEKVYMVVGIVGLIFLADILF